MVELAVVFDRAALLEEHGAVVQVVQLFEDTITPRNTLLLATARTHGAAVHCVPREAAR
jgi:hypothetical protein